MDALRASVLGRVIALLLAMQVFGAALCGPVSAAADADETVAVALAEHSGEPCREAEIECHERLCHPALTASVEAVALESVPQHPLHSDWSFAHHASGPHARPPLPVSA